jgi:hypothetical protein
MLPRASGRCARAASIQASVDTVLDGLAAAVKARRR